MHDLLWEYAALALAQEPEQNGEEARDRLLNYYNRACALAAASIEPSRQDSSSSATSSRATERPDTEKSPSGWLDAERVNLVAAVTAAAEHGRELVALELAGRLTHYLQRGYRWDDKITIDQACLDIARRRRDKPGAANCLCAIGLSLHVLSRFSEGADCYQQALVIDRELRGQNRGCARPGTSSGWAGRNVVLVNSLPPWPTCARLQGCARPSETTTGGAVR